MTADLLADIIGPEEAAALIGIHINTAHKWCKAGTMPGLLPRVGGRYRIRRSQLEAWLLNQPDGTA